MNTETFERLLKQAVPDGKTIREIRIRTEKPVMILLESGENLLFSDGTCGKTESYGKKKMGSLEIREDRSVVLADQELIRGILETCSRHSLYAYEREISQGFLTICGGHRVGIAGKAVVEDGHVRTVRRKKRAAVPDGWGNISGHAFDLPAGSRKDNTFEGSDPGTFMRGNMGSGEECVRGGRAFGDRSVFWRNCPV